MQTQVLLLWLKKLLYLQDLHLESTFSAELPGDPNTKNRRRQVMLQHIYLLDSMLPGLTRLQSTLYRLLRLSPLQVEGAFYSYASPTPTNTEPSTVAYSPGKPHAAA